MPDDTILEMKEKSEVAVPLDKRCGTCRWWLKALVPPDQQEAWGQKVFNFGECRAVPPTALASNRTYESAGEAGRQKATVSIKQARFPHTYDLDWCGSWTAKDSE